MQAPEDLDLLTSAKSIRANDESPVSHGGQLLGREVTSQHVASVTIPVCVREMRGYSNGAIGQDRLEIRPIIMVFFRLRDFYAIQSELH